MPIVMKITANATRLPCWVKGLITAVLVVLALGAQQAVAQITRVGASFVAVNANSGTGAVPAGTSAGDIMVAAVSVRGTGQTINLPAGWTPVQSQPSGTAAIAQRVLYKFAGASEPAPTFTWNNPDRGTVTIVTYRNVAAVVLAESSGLATSASTTIAAPGFAFSANNSMLVGFFGIADNRAVFSGSTLNPIFGATAEPSSGAGPNGLRVYVGDLLVNPPNTPAQSVTSSNSADNIGQMLVLRPARSFLVEAFGGGAIGTQIAGTSFNIRITARTPAGATDTAFNGTVTITSTGNLSVGSGVTASFVNGVLVSHTVRISNTGTFTITATETGVPTSSGVSNSFLVVPKLQILVPGETANPGSPTGKLGTPLTQTQGVAFNVTVNAVDEFWNLVATATDTVNITSSDPGAVLPPAAALSGGTRTFSVILNTPPNATLTADAATPTRTDTSPPVPIATAGGSFNACDVAATCTNATPSTYIKTKVAGSNFNLDIVALKSDGSLDTNYNAMVRVELLDASNNTGALDSDNCRPTWSTIATLVPDPSFSPANNGRITVGPLNVPNAYRDVRVRITSQSGASRRGCSTDNFAIRPSSFAAFSVSDDGTPNNAGTTRALNSVTFGAVFHKAGRPVSVRANAVNAAGTPAITTNYTGTPTASITACAGAACTATFGTLTLGTTFAAGQLVTDVASYSDVGSFSLQLIDDTFAAVDNADSSAAERQIQSAALDVGRFVPDNFAVTYNVPSFSTACGAGNFSYVGQTFGYATQPVITVVARDAANNTTTLYAGAWWRITNASLTGKAYSVATGALDTSGAPGTDPVIAPAGLGTGTLTFSAGTGFLFTRTTPVPPFDAEVSLAINVIDADGVTLATNPARFGMPSAGNGIAFSTGKQMRFGRMRVSNANGSTLVPITLVVEAQNWLEPTPGKGYFVTNTADTCTALVAANIAMDAYRKNLNACETSITVGGFSGGRATLRLSAPGAGNDGSVNLTPNLGAAGGGSTCIAGVATPVTGANTAYLQGNWTGGAYDQNPAGRATFGAYRGGEETIFQRENF